MRVAIIGGGHIAFSHVPVIEQQDDVAIVGVADVDITRAKAAARDFNISNYFDDAEAMIMEQKPDIVHVLTPPQHHAQNSIMAMKHGCHVFVEKPMALMAGDAKSMIEEAVKNNVKLCVGHSALFSEVVRRARELALGGVVGDIVSVEAYQSFEPTRYQPMTEEGAEFTHWIYGMNGGPLEDLMPHSASLVLEFMSDLREVHCVSKSHGRLPEGWPDEIRVIINSSSIMGYISLSLNEKPEAESLTIKGKKGTIQADTFSNILIVRTKSDLPRAVTRGLAGFQVSRQSLREAVSNIYKFATGTVHKNNSEPVISKFYEAVRKKGKMPVSLDMSLRVVELMNRVWPEPVVDIKQKLPSFEREHRSSCPSVLVTGASGLIGTYLIKKLLSEKKDVRALVRPNSLRAGRMKKLDIDIMEVEMSDENALRRAVKGIKTVIHAAASDSSDFEEQTRTTINGTRHLINASLDEGIERFVQFGSLAVYELLDIHDTNIAEGSKYQKSPERMGAYAYSKIEVEKLALNAHRENGLGVTVVRPGKVIGPLGPVFFPHLGFRLPNNIFLMIGDGDTVLPLTYIENTVDGIYRAAFADNAVGQIYNLVDDGHVTPKKYLELFVKVTGINARIISLPFIFPYTAATAYEVAAFLGAVKKGVTSRAQMKSKQSKVIFDNTKAKKELGWETEIPLEEGLTRTFDWFRKKYIL